jgi:hypothetical protein
MPIRALISGMKSDIDLEYSRNFIDIFLHFCEKYKKLSGCDLR